MMGKSPAIWAASIAMVAFGQALNAGIYNAIGKNGVRISITLTKRHPSDSYGHPDDGCRNCGHRAKVYYGFKLGKKVPWVRADIATDAG